MGKGVVFQSRKARQGRWRLGQRVIFDSAPTNNHNSAWRPRDPFPACSPHNPRPCRASKDVPLNLIHQLVGTIMDIGIVWPASGVKRIPNTTCHYLLELLSPVQFASILLLDIENPTKNKNCFLCKTTVLPPLLPSFFPSFLNLIDRSTSHQLPSAAGLFSTCHSTAT